MRKGRMQSAISSASITPELTLAPTHSHTHTQHRHTHSHLTHTHSLLHTQHATRYTAIYIYYIFPPPYLLLSLPSSISPFHVHWSDSPSSMISLTPPPGWCAAWLRCLLQRGVHREIDWIEDVERERETDPDANYVKRPLSVRRLPAIPASDKGQWLASAQWPDIEIYTYLYTLLCWSWCRVRSVTSASNFVFNVRSLTIKDMFLNK